MTNKYGLRLKKLREENGYTQESLARKLNTSRSRIGMYEQGKRQPDFEMQETIADLFNVSIDYLFGRELEIQARTSNEHIEAERLYNLYEKASPEVQQAVELILRSAQPRL